MPGELDSKVAVVDCVTVNIVPSSRLENIAKPTIYLRSENSLNANLSMLGLIAPMMPAATTTNINPRLLECIRFLM